MIIFNLLIYYKKKIENILTNVIFLTYNKYLFTVKNQVNPTNKWEM